MRSPFALTPLLILAALLVAPALAGASGPQASASGSCGNATRLVAYGIKTAHVSCRTAKSTVIPQWRKKCGPKHLRRCKIASRYTCRFKFNGYDGGTVSCTRGSRKVTWRTT